MKVSFEIVEKEGNQINIHEMLIKGDASSLIISTLPQVFGRIMGAIIRDSFDDPMAKVKLPKPLTKAFRKAMEEEIHGINLMIDRNLVSKEADNEHS